MSKAKKNILFAALAALALTVCLVGVTGAYFIAQASRTNTLTVGEVTFDYTVLLCFCLFKTSSLSRSILGAH